MAIQLSMASAPPFFIVGCARSGTTLLRDLLRLHPNLDAPEETFFYRWGEPFATDAYKQVYLTNPTIKKHQELDGIDAKQLRFMLNRSVSRRDFNTRYASSFLEKSQHGKRWFDKTPQNIYGLLLLHAQFPKSKIIHIHRHPFNVIASLREGKVMPKQSLMAAINYWLEAIQIISVYRKMPKNNLIEISYEDLTSKPVEMLVKLFEDLDEDPSSYDFSKLLTPATFKGMLEPAQVLVKPEQNKFQDVLTEHEIALIVRHCGAYMKRFGYATTLEKGASYH